MNNFSKQITPILLELEGALIDRAAAEIVPEGFNQEALRAATMIFQSVLLDHMWNLQEWENMPQKQREEMANHAGSQIRKLIKEMTGLESHNFYKP